MAQLHWLLEYKKYENFLHLSKMQNKVKIYYWGAVLRRFIVGLWRVTAQSSLPRFLELESVSKFLFSMVQMIRPFLENVESTTLNPNFPKMFNTSTGSILMRYRSVEIWRKQHWQLYCKMSPKNSMFWILQDIQITEPSELNSRVFQKWCLNYQELPVFSLLFEWWTIQLSDNILKFEYRNIQIPTRL